MNVLHTWAIGIGAAALALPILVHWLTKPKPVRFETSTLRFLRGALRERRALNRLRDFVVLALRTCAILLAAAAFARPYFSEADAAARHDAAVRVVLLDVSQSMAAAERGVSTFERARASALDRLNYRPGASANLILAASGAQPVFAAPSTNFAALRDELRRAQVRPERLEPTKALEAAAAMFDERAGVHRELVIVSDFQRAGWSRADFGIVPQDVVITFESVAPAVAPANLAVVGGMVRSRSSRGREAEVVVEVGNFGPNGRTVDVEVRIGDAVGRLQGACAPYSRTTLTSDMTITGDAWQWGSARLIGVSDAVEADNIRPLLGRFRTAPRMALVTRVPSSRRPSSPYFLASALEPASPAQDAPTRLTRVDPSSQSPETAVACDVVVLDRPGKLSEEWLAQLAGAGRRGKVLIYVAEEAVDAANLQLLAKAATGDWRFPVEFAPADKRTSLVKLGEVKVDRRPFSVFGEQAAATMTPLRFRAGLATSPSRDALQDDVLAAYADRTACLAVGSIGAGRIAVLNVDLEASLLPRTEAFVPLVGELVNELLEAGNQISVVDCGSPLAAYLPVDAGPAETLQGLDAEGEEFGRLRAEQLGMFWDAPSLPKPGVYRVERDGATVLAVGAVVPAEESDLRTLPADVLTGRLAGGRTTVYRGLEQRRESGDRLWAWLVVGCIGCMLSEIVALRWFRT